MKHLSIGSSILILTLISISICSVAQPIMELKQINTNPFSSVVSITNCGDDRLFIVEQPGRIFIMNKNGQRVTPAFLDISTRVQSGGERGLLGLAFHPNYAENGQFFVNYTRTGGGASVIARFKVDPANPNRALADSEEVLFTVNQPFTNHNGGDIRFGQDGFLYISLGDGGSGGDPQNLSQNRQTLLGKLLRIDVSSEETGYTIPPTNPFANEDETLDEIWALGLRNAWRFSFDRATGDLWIADVGQNALEEINFTPASSTGGENYGWRCYEGTRPFNLNGCLDASNYTFPLFEYSHNQGDRSVTGGFVYRGNAYPALQGNYLFADFVSSRFFRLKRTETELESEVIGVLGLPSPSTFGEDNEGELYVASYFNGLIYQVTDFCQAFYPTLSFETENNLQIKVALENGGWSEDIEVEWYLNDELITINQDSILNFISNGTYQAIINHSRGCSLTSEPFEVIHASTESTSLPKDIILTPNPFTDQIRIEHQERVLSSLTILSIQGQVLTHQNIQGKGTTNLQVASLPAGTYFVRITSDKGTAWTSKIIRH